MNSNNNLTTLILEERECLSLVELSNYANCTLSADQAHDAEMHLIDCPFCSDALEGISLLDHTEQFVSLNQKVKEDLDKLLQRPEPRETRVIPFYRRFNRIAVAASLAGLLAVAGIYTLQNQEQHASASDTAQLYQQSYDPVAQVAGNSRDLFLFQVRDAFLAGNLEKVMEMEGNMDDNDPYKVPAQFYFAQAQIQTGHFDEAEINLRGIINSGEPAYIQHAEWLLGQVFLSRGDMTKARELFQNISQNQDHQYQKDALSALKTLESVR
ncbi:MAG: tetratricopeptide repeat protein [Bacteroidia bacterium]|nr:tetratricopeptide repeat protein [Bacteroidia bacterium]